MPTLIVPDLVALDQLMNVIQIRIVNENKRQKADGVQ